MGSWVGPIGGIIIFLFTIFLASRWKERQERRAHAFGLAQSVDFLDDALPGDLPSELLAALPTLQVRHCFSGVRLGERVVSFDSMAGISSLKHFVTVVALKQRHPQRYIEALAEPTATRAGDWAFVQIPNVPARPTVDVAAIWDRLRTTTDEEVSSLKQSRPESNLHIVPRHDVRRGNRR
jgi:hypothetical protein